MKTIVKLAIGLGFGFVVAYVALPDARAFILAISPLLLVLICPLAMGAMMLAMKGENAKPKADEPPPVSPETGRDKS